MMQINGRTVDVGTELSVRRKSGRYIFKDSSQTSAGRTVLTLIGPVNSGREAFHACYLEDVQTVHRVSRAAERRGQHQGSR